MAVTKQNPINPAASKEAKELLAYLYDLSEPGAGMLTGQHCWIEDPLGNINSLALPYTAGDYPAVVGWEMGPISGQSLSTVYTQRYNVVTEAIKHWQAKGIVTLTFHQVYPGSGTSYTWSNVQRGTSQAEFDQCLTPGDPKYVNMLAEWDRVAEHLKRLRDAKVPVLWRPFHEMNGYWFWWCNKTTFSTLWNLMYDRYTNFHQLDNLLWVWSPNCMKATDPNIRPMGQFYPGHSKVDALAQDIYLGEYTQAHHDLLYATGGNAKPIAIGECDTVPDIGAMEGGQPRYAWCMVWGDSNGIVTAGNTPMSRIGSVYYQAAKAVNRSKVNIPPVSGGGTDPGGEEPPPPDPGEVFRHISTKDFQVPAISITSPPRKIGQLATVGTKKYWAVGTSSVMDWHEVGGIGSGGTPIITNDVVLQSPNGKYWKLVVSNTGVVTAEEVTGGTPTGNTIFSDNFNRADNNATPGTGYVAEFGIWGIQNNKLYSVSAVDGNVLTRDLGAGQNNYVIEVKVAGQLDNAANVSTPMTLFRITDIINFLSVHLYNGKVYLDKMDANTNSTLASGTVATFTNGTEYAIKITVNGNRIIVYVNGTQYIDHTLVTADQAKFGAGTKIGFKLERFGTVTVLPTWDDLVVSTIA